jgi:hypothetical protein
MLRVMFCLRSAGMSAACDPALLERLPGWWRVRPLAAVEGRAGGAALYAFVYGVIVVANASVRLLVSPLLVCTKNDLNAAPSFASPW